MILMILLLPVIDIIKFKIILKGVISMSFPHEYLPEILAITKENNASWDVGLNMFLNNVKDANDPNDQYFYHGADHLDYVAIQAEHPEVMDSAKEADMINDFCDWYRAHVDEIQAMYAKGDTEALRELGKSIG